MPSYPKFSYSSGVAAQKYGLQRISHDTRRDIDTNRDGSLSVEEVEKAARGAGLNTDRFMDAAETARLQSYLQANSTAPTTPTTPTSTTTPSTNPSTTTPSSTPSTPSTPSSTTPGVRTGPGLRLSSTTLAQATPEGRARLEAWQHLINDNQNKSDAEKIKLVNNFFNHNIRYTSDEQNNGVSDYWSTPIDILKSGRGDCEDYTIAKYVTLRRMGFDADDLRMIVGKLPYRGNIAHMVLVQYPKNGDDPTVLDNLTDFRPTVADSVEHFTPIYSFNEVQLRSVFVGDDAKKWRGMFALGMDRLSKWEGVQERMEDQQLWPIPR